MINTKIAKLINILTIENKNTSKFIIKPNAAIANTI